MTTVTKLTMTIIIMTTIHIYIINIVMVTSIPKHTIRIQTFLFLAQSDT